MELQLQFLSVIIYGSNVKDAKYEIYKRALVQDRVKEIFPKESIHSLRKMYDRYMKESGGKLK